MNHPPNIHQVALVLATRSYERTNGLNAPMPIHAPTTQVAKALATKGLATVQVMPSMRGGSQRVSLTPVGRELANRLVAMAAATL